MYVFLWCKVNKQFKPRFHVTHQCVQKTPSNNLQNTEKPKVSSKSTQGFGFEVIYSHEKPKVSPKSTQGFGFEVVYSNKSVINVVPQKIDFKPKIITDNKDKRYNNSVECEICSKIFKYESQYRYHRAHQCPPHGAGRTN